MRGQNRHTKMVDSITGETDYGYDAQGNLALRNGVPYSFDYGNRLRGVTGYEGSYAYDANGRRVQQQDASGGVINSFYDHAGQLIYQRSRDGTTHDYLYLQGRLVAIRDYDVNGVATAMRYQHTDALGSIIRQTDHSGAEIVGNVYDPWGKLLAGSTPDSPGYTGHVMDASTNLIYMQQRYYDPDAMRFLSMDPVDASTTNGSNLDRYWYASDNPYRYTDPDGRQDTPNWDEPLTQRMDGLQAADQEAQLAKQQLASILSSGMDAFNAAVTSPGFVNATSGIESVASFGISDHVQDALGYGSDVDRSSGAYKGASNVAMVVGMVTGEGEEQLAAKAINPKIYVQLEGQLARDGASSIHKALRTATNTLAEHQEKLQQILRDGGYPSQVQGTIRNVESQIETLKKFIKDNEL